MTRRPGAHEYAPFFAGYVALVPEEEILPVLAAQVAEVRALAQGVPAAQETFRYAPGKWSVREVFGHLADAERLFGYRALAIARGGEEPLPGFDENGSVTRAAFDVVPLPELAGGWAAARESNLALLRHLPPEAWLRSGTANGAPVSTRSLAWIMAGHVRHHVAVLGERYGVGSGG